MSYTFNEYTEIITNLKIYLSEGHEEYHLNGSRAHVPMTYKRRSSISLEIERLRNEQIKLIQSEYYH